MDLLAVSSATMLRATASQMTTMREDDQRRKTTRSPHCIEQKLQILPVLGRYCIIRKTSPKKSSTVTEDTYLSIINFEERQLKGACIVLRKDNERKLSVMLSAPESRTITAPKRDNRST